MARWGAAGTGEALGEGPGSAWAAGHLDVKGELRLALEYHGVWKTPSATLLGVPEALGLLKLGGFRVSQVSFSHFSPVFAASVWQAVPVDSSLVDSRSKWRRDWESSSLGWKSLAFSHELWDLESDTRLLRVALRLALTCALHHTRCVGLADFMCAECPVELLCERLLHVTCGRNWPRSAGAPTVCNSIPTKGHWPIWSACDPSKGTNKPDLAGAPHMPAGVGFLCLLLREWAPTSLALEDDGVTAITNRWTMWALEVKCLQIQSEERPTALPGFCHKAHSCVNPCSTAGDLVGGHVKLNFRGTTGMGGIPPAPPEECSPWIGLKSCLRDFRTL